MNIWKVEKDIAAINEWGKGTMVEYLEIVFTEKGGDFLEATMPVDHRTRQPLGLLHGGASVVLAETIGSTAANLCVDSRTQYCVGLDINANHVRSAHEGLVTGTARPIHLGRSTQIWEIIIRDEKDRLVCISRLTMAVMSR